MDGHRTEFSRDLHHTHPVGGEALFVRHLNVIERVVAFVCARNRVSATDADDFASHVKLRIVESDYEILTKFAGRSSLRTYLVVVIQRLFLDYRISAWGKWRPSAEATRAGPVAILLEQLLVRDGYTFEEACELLSTRHGVETRRIDLERLAGKLPAKFKRRFEAEATLSTVASPGPDAEHSLIEGERQRVATLVSTTIQRLMAAFDQQDRLILTLRFVDGRTVAEIASVLRLDQKSLYRRVERLLGRLRADLENEGIQREAIVDMLESPAVILQWGNDAGITVASPSIGQEAR
jgi:RNA polymerase sigma factor (sigma-70 family)